MPVATHDLVGREAELEAISMLLDAGDRLPGAIVLHGDAGVGKTSLWLRGLEGADARGYRILACRPSDAETGFSYAALDDLLGDVTSRVLPDLPPIQRRALEVALLLADPDAEAHPRAVGAAFLAAIRLLASERPLCIAVDDVQWLDAASLTALRFALQRLEHEPVAVLLACRGASPAWIARSFPAPLSDLAVGGLSVGATRQLIDTRLGITFVRPTLLRIHETSGGNPFFALELAGALQRRDVAPAPGEPLPITENLTELLRERLDGLSRAAHDVVDVVAALAEPTADLVEAALPGDSDAGLVEALEARIVELEGDRLRFTHPLLGSAVAVRLTPSRRRALHARLASVAPTNEERARHLALAANRADAEIAGAIEAAARSAQARGAPASAAQLAEQALRLTPEVQIDDARRRLFLAAQTHDVAGDTERAIVLLEQALNAAPAGTRRAAVLVQLADMQADPRAVAPLCEQALAEATGDASLEATTHIRLASLMAWGEGAERGAEHAELAVRASRRTDDAEVRCRALAARAEWHFRAGRGIAHAELSEARELERTLASWPLDRGPTDLLARQLVWAAELEPARGLLHELRDAHRSRNDADGEATACWWLGLLEWRAGNWDASEGLTAASLEIRTQLGHVMPTDYFPGSIVAAHRGRVDDARASAEREKAEGEAMGIRISVSGSSWVLGFVELSVWNAEAALPHLRRSYEIRDAFMLEPAQRVELGDLLEALIQTGELDEADAILEEWDPRAAAVDRAWALAILARCRGLLQAARGDLDKALASFERALAEHARAADPFHQARTLLALGRTQRRAKKRGAARVTLEDALARFEALGAPLWSEQTRAELARIGGRAPSRGDLTEAERRIALLVADGRTNREVAAALFLTEHSVETALTRIYRKLGVRSRGELARTGVTDG